MLKNGGLWTLLMLAVSTAPVLAHGDKTHVMGTVATVGGGAMEVETRKGERVSVRLVRTTTYRNVDGDRTDARPAVGQRVVVDVAGPADRFTATDVRFAPSGAPTGSHHDERSGGH